MDAIPVILSAANTIAGGISQIFTNDQNQRNYMQSLQHNVDMWHKNNAYNHPAAVMQRLSSAGLSPHLVYGQGGVTPSTQISPLQRPQNVAPSFSVDPSMFVALKQLEMQKKSNDADVELKEAQTNKVIADTDMVDIQKQLVSTQTKIQEQLYDFNTRKNIQEIRSMDLDNDLKDQLMDLTVELSRLQNEKYRQEIFNEQYLREYKAQLMAAQTDSAHASAHSSRVNANWTEAQKDFFLATRDVVADTLSIDRDIKFHQGWKNLRERNKTIQNAIEDSEIVQGINGLLNPVASLLRFIK